jgi:hypothetical protein
VENLEGIGQLYELITKKISPTVGISKNFRFFLKILENSGRLLTLTERLASRTLTGVVLKLVNCPNSNREHIFWSC